MYRKINRTNESRDQSKADRGKRRRENIVAWTSLPFGVVNLAERYGGKDVPADVYESMVSDVVEQLEGADASEFHYRVIFKPSVIVPDIDTEVPGEDSE